MATDGSTRLIFTIFAVGFPLIVLAVFSWLLVKYPANLYSPWQYTSEVGIETYTAALSRQFRTTSRVYSQATMDALAYADQGEAENVKTREAVAKRIEELVQDSSITIDRSNLMKGARPLQIPVTDETTVGDLLDNIYFEISPVVHPFTYGSSWLLIDEAGSALTEMGTRWAGHVRDERTLDEAGVNPGSKLRVIDPSALRGETLAA